MKKLPILLFALRLFFYLSTALLILLHPGIIISYDTPGVILWFIIIPAEMLLAFLSAPEKKPKVLYITAFALLFVLSLWAGGFVSSAISIFAIGASSYFLTLFLFHYPKWGKISAAEPFLFAWILLRLLNFSRSGEEAALEYSGITQFILVWTFLVFLLHNVVVYFCLFPGSLKGSKKEGIISALTAAAVLIAVVFFLPADFVRNTVAANLLQDRKEKLAKESDSEWGLPETGGRRRGRDTIPGDDRGNTPDLRGLPGRDWPGEGNRRGGNNGDQRQQYTVMVVASKMEPVYMGNNIRGRLDAKEGFLTGFEETLNRLPSQRLFVTWFDNEAVTDRSRQHNEVFSLSTLPQKFLPYRPYSVEPTVQSENTGPFRYIHRLVSNMHRDDPMNLLRRPIRNLSPLEKTALLPYLELPLEKEDLDIFKSILSSFEEAWEEKRNNFTGEARNEYMEKIFTILTGFSTYKYNANDGNDFSIEHLIKFLLETKDGDCVELSNTAAIMARLYGIPSRVVTGYLAAESLQTQAHLRGLAALRSRIPALQEFPFNDLFLVTDAHGHSWPQFYIPDFGWLDFEATAFAIPPLGFGDGNSRDVVIPLLDENQVISRVLSFPWKQVFRGLISLATLSLLGAYCLRYGRDIFLSGRVKTGGRNGARSLYLLLLSQLAAEGKPIKPVSKTAPEYSNLFGKENKEQIFADFAEIYTEIRWRNFTDKTEENEKLILLKAEYKKILEATRRKGVVPSLTRIFSLRPLKYL